MKGSFDIKDRTVGRSENPHGRIVIGGLLKEKFFLWFLRGSGGGGFYTPIPLRFRQTWKRPLSWWLLVTQKAPEPNQARPGSSLYIALSWIYRLPHHSDMKLRFHSVIVWLLCVLDFCMVCKCWGTFWISLLKNQKFHFVFKKSQKIGKKRQWLCNSSVQNSWKECKLLSYWSFWYGLKWLVSKWDLQKLDHCVVHEGCALGLTFITKGTMRIINVRIYTYIYSTYILWSNMYQVPSSALVPLIALYHIVRI